MDSFLQDVRYAIRALGRRPLVAAGAIVSLAVGIAATTVVFSVVNGVLLKEVPGVTRPERLAEIARDVGGRPADVTYPMYRHLREQSAVLDDLAALVLESVSIAAGGADAEPSVRGALVVTDNYFSLLGVRAERGRLFAPDEARYPAIAPVAVISHDVWQRELGARDDVVGVEIRVNGTPVRVIGVLERGFAGHHTGLLTDVFLPLGLDAPGLPDAANFASGGASSVELLGRLREGMTPAPAARALGVAADAFGRQVGESSERHPYAVAVVAWGPLPHTVRTAVGAFLAVLFLLSGLGLAMAGMNVSTILLAQASERQRELAVRRAVGASQSRLVRQIVTEVGVLFVVAGAVGAIAAIWTAGLFNTFEPPVPIPGRLGADFSVDASVLVFSFALTLGAALVFSVLPAFQSSRFNIVPALREAGASDTRGRSRMRSWLVGAQVTVTSVLLSATLLFGRALANMRALEPGWNGDGVVVAPIDLELNGTSPAQGLLTQQRLLERLAAIPGVDVTALATKLPMGGRSSFGLVRVPGVEAPSGLPGFSAALNRVSPEYFSAMRIPLLHGRDIAPTDDERSRLVAVINETMARRLWPTIDPVGRTFFVDQPNRALEFHVVGVVADAQRRVPRQAPENFYYVPAQQWYNSAVVLHVRSSPGLETGVVAAVRLAVRDVDPSLPLPVVRPLNEALDIYLTPQRLAAWVSGAMGAFGLLLALVGIYGTTAFLVSRRAREMAIRMALGATDADVVRMIVWRGGRAPLVGLGVGILFGGALAIGASNVVAGARAIDPVVIGAVPLVLALTVALAMLTPLRRLLRAPLADRLRDD
ncbi:MAG: ADOP family duplicated permease [Gemmatimonadaceae bacterium]